MTAQENMNQVQFKTSRVAAGHYQVSAPKGTYTLRKGDPSKREWMLTYPGRADPDDVYYSKGEGMDAIRQHHEGQSS